MQISNKSLGILKRKRNLKHMLRYTEDTQHISDNFENFLNGYAKTTSPQISHQINNKLHLLLKNKEII